MTPPLASGTPRSNDTQNMTIPSYAGNVSNQTVTDISNDIEGILEQNSDGKLDTQISDLINKTVNVREQRGVLTIKDADIPIVYEEVGPFRILEGDTFLTGLEDNLTGVRAAFDRPEAAIDSFVISSPWPEGKIPVAIQSSFQSRPEMLKNIGRALTHVETATNNAVNFVGVTTDNAGNILDPAYLRFVLSGPYVDNACGTFIGMLPRNAAIKATNVLFKDGQYHGQPVFVPAWCQWGSLAHELGHTAGLWHEQTRCDAVTDGWIKINTNNIIQGKKGQYIAKCDPSNPSTAPTTYGTPYDYCSIMHYPAGGGNAKNPNFPIIEPLKSLNGCNKIGQREGYSPGDINAIQLIYGLQQ
jgi:hypothetical protein